MDKKPQPQPWKSASITLATEGQTKEKVFELLSAVFGKTACYGCGRLVKLDMTFGEDPGPELAEHGATSVSHD
jgi:hypothetical protein